MYVYIVFWGLMLFEYLYFIYEAEENKISLLTQIVMDKQMVYVLFRGWGVRMNMGLMW